MDHYCPGCGRVDGRCVCEIEFAPEEPRGSRMPVIECKGCSGTENPVDPETGLCADCAAWGEAILADVA